MVARATNEVLMARLERSVVGGEAPNLRKVADMSVAQPPRVSSEKLGDMNAWYCSMPMVLKLPEVHVLISDSVDHQSAVEKHFSVDR